MTSPNRDEDEEVAPKYELLPEAPPAKDPFSEWFQEQVNRQCTEIDLSKADPHSIISQNMAAIATLDRLRNEVFPGLPEIAAAIGQEGEAAFNETFLKAVDMACYLLAVVCETNKIIFERLSKNGTNRNFGFLVLAVTTGNEEMRKDTEAELLRIALSIPLKKKKWFHPNEPEVWKELATGVLHDELLKYENLDLSGVLERMLGNEFAYIYIAFEREFIDELRRLYRRQKREQQFPEFESEAFGSGAQEIEVAEAEQQRLGVIKLIRQLESSPKLPPGPRELIHQLSIYVEQPSKFIEIDQRGHAIHEVAQRVGVSEQQVRSYRQELRSLAKHDSDIGRGVRKLAEQVLKLRLRFCVRDAKDGDEH
jgi:hypothetical protein